MCGFRRRLDHLRFVAVEIVFAGAPFSPLTFLIALPKVG